MERLSSEVARASRAAMGALDAVRGRVMQHRTVQR
jgi:hypothetical protein